ncbi:MAG: acyl carrier protein [Pseudomonadota bacterium]
MAELKTFILAATREKLDILDKKHEELDDDTLFGMQIDDIGLDSLRLLELVMEIEQELSIELSEADFSNLMTLNELADLAAGS